MERPWTAEITQGPLGKQTLSKKSSYREPWVSTENRAPSVCQASNLQTNRESHLGNSFEIQVLPNVHRASWGQEPLLRSQGKTQSSEPQAETTWASWISRRWNTEAQWTPGCREDLPVWAPTVAIGLTVSRPHREQACKAWVLISFAPLSSPSLPSPLSSFLPRPSPPSPALPPLVKSYLSVCGVCVGMHIHMP